MEAKFREVSETKSLTLHALTTALAFTFLAWLIQYHWKRRRLYKMAAQREGPATIPIIGNGWNFTGSNLDIFNYTTHILNRYDSPFPVWLGQRLFFPISKPEHLEIIMNSPHALAKEYLYKFSEPIVGHGIFSAPVLKWKKNRKIIMPTFNQKILDSFVEVFSEQAVILAQQLEKEIGKGHFDVFEYFCKFSLDAICETAMGVKVNAQTTQSEFVKWANRAMAIAFNRMFVVFYHFDFIFNLTSLARELKDYSRKIREFTENVVKQKKEEYRQSLEDTHATPEALVDEVLPKRTTFLAQLIKLSAEGAHLTDDELRDEVNTVMIAGSETTASVNSYTLIMLGMHPDIQEKVYEEIIDAIGRDRPVLCEDLHNLPYTEMVIKETMRLFPVGPLVVRAVTEDIKLDNCIIPKDSSAVLAIITTHRDPKIYHDPLEFDPLRFSPQESATRHPYSFMPFSGGPRNCIGIKYAYMAMKTVIATVVRKYKITTSYKSIDEIKLQADLVLKPVDGYPIALTLRE